jgi:hydrogenase/urease accessory protein HupE
VKRRLALAAAMAVVTGFAIRTSAHSTPFSYVDARLHDGRLDVTLSAHVVDVAHELAIDSPELLLQAPATPDTVALLGALQQRLSLRIDGRAIRCDSRVTADRIVKALTIRWSYSCNVQGVGQVLSLDGPLFPYDPEHLTFVNVYVDGALTGQAVLDRSVRHASFSIGAPQSRRQMVHRFLVAGIEHILSGPDHLLFLAGLLLLGGSFGRLAAIVTAFTAAHSITLALAVLNVVAPPPALIEPLIALSIVFVGVNNLRAPSGGEWRILAAGTFGLIHGFGFANALREMQLSQSGLGWSLLSFNLGVEIGQLAVVVVVASLLEILRRSGLVAPRRLVVVGSLVVAAAGAFWFVERVIATWRPS